MPPKKYLLCPNNHDNIWNESEMNFISPNIRLHRTYIKITKDKKTKWIGVGWYCRECGYFKS